MFTAEQAMTCGIRQERVEIAESHRRLDLTDTHPQKYSIKAERSHHFVKSRAVQEADGHSHMTKQFGGEKDQRIGCPGRVSALSIVEQFFRLAERS